MIHIWTADIYEGDMWSSQWIGMKKPEKKKKKNQGFNGIRSRDLRDTGAMLYQLSYEAFGLSRVSQKEIKIYFTK